MTTVETPPFSDTVTKRLAQMWGLVDQAGVTAAQHRLEDAVDGYESVTVFEIDLRAAERNAKEALDMATFAAEQNAQPHFEPDGAKTWQLDQDGNRVRTVTADDRRAWITNFVRVEMGNHPAMVAWRDADNNLTVVRNDVTVAAARLSAARHSLDAAAAVLAVISLAIPR